MNVFDRRGCGRHWRSIGDTCSVDSIDRQAHTEGRADADLALNLDRAPHHAAETVADGQAQSGATILAGRGAVGLAKFLEQLGELFLSHSDAGVGDARRKKLFAIASTATDR